jgi:mono/diheme cytochrome c family protein
MRSALQFRFAAAVVLLSTVALSSCNRDSSTRRAETSIDVGAGPDFLQALDGGIKLSEAEIKGRNAWHLWSAGNDAFWDELARRTCGFVDLLRMLDSRHRGARFAELGLINEPGYRQATKPDEFGLWIDERAVETPSPIDAKIYGRSSGVLGFRIFPNPNFTGTARDDWNAERYYNDPTYAANRNLIRPYRVGVSCSACHVAPHPLHPPADPEKPGWNNLASVIGNQYLHEGRVFAAGAKPGTFFWEMLKAQPRGTSDTSRLATDNINNPSAINSIFLLRERSRIAHEENVSGETLCLPETQPRMKVPRLIKDGADSVGFFGAVLRVYVNTGLFHEHWLETHQLLFGFSKQEPFSICRARDESPQWRATAAMLPNLKRFFERIEPMHLADAPGGDAYLTRDRALLDRGRTAFAQHCAGCHSSKQPPKDTADRKAWFLAQSNDPAFWSDNFLSDEERHPVTDVQTNAARAMATNATAGHVWQWFSSDTYKTAGAPAAIEVWNPYSEENEQFTIPADGRGYYRTPSLVSVWATAPFLHNNSVGRFNGDPSVKGRLEAFQDAIEKLLWPEKRLDRDSIWRTSAECQIELPGALIPEEIRKLLGTAIDSDGVFRLGPIPKGTPINLLANINPQADPAALVTLGNKIREVLQQIRDQNLDPDATRLLMKRELAPMFFKLSKCPDLIEDRGHLYGTKIPDADKLALIEFLKTL